MMSKYFQLDRKNIVAVQFIIEGYEGLATVTTIDAAVAVIQISIMPDFLREMNCLLDELSKKYHMKELVDDRIR
ncbi:MAG TPA: DUF4911 domain-containing protein [Smithella sp.]|jgi:hypothetical protein|nr:DUF4911 domain-containing protein [Smithella sp.]HNQ65479.1 DUF4911 domain-containing protein [Smithella sp.]HOE32418.1 DUF4911 domain-containing protein [Smithella sp.]HOG08889.1 DUF4911 domain-containing protein [Smithella sp.]HOO35551.1 DUF4911 domain-containing protein [Smithella sp.]